MYARFRSSIIADSSGDGEGALDFDPVIAGQDYKITKLKFGTPKLSGQTAVVIVTFNNFAEHDTLIATVGHAGDGNFHPFLSFDGADPGAVQRADAAFGAIIALALDLGGTITGEHGVGLLKRDWLAEELGPVGLALQRRVKAAFDPLGLLNPGKVL